ncbi:MAG TPA: hypothetical protein PKN75_14745 [Bacteroidia bacterium]|nr:hypothetical protein [Bacteroidia bacterium]HNU34844.1 hypothetical protein [Bacteroidia bacterium]
MNPSTILIILFLYAITAKGQPNCNVYLWNSDTAQYKACKLLTENQHKYYQFSKEFHQLVDSAIQVCPYFAYAYREKAAPYVKSGNFILWKQYIDLAVKYDTLSYLPVRASLRYKFFGDYSGAIEDIKLLEKLNKSDIGSTSNGTYHLSVVKALCYKQMNNLHKGIRIMENLLSSKNYIVGSYDRFHLGVMYYQNKQYEKAIEMLNKQVKENDLSEARYFLSLCYKISGRVDEYNQSKLLALKLYDEQKRMSDPYHFMIDQITKQEISNI